MLSEKTIGTKHSLKLAWLRIVGAFCSGSVAMDTRPYCVRIFGPGFDFWLILVGRVPFPNWRMWGYLEGLKKGLRKQKSNLLRLSSVHHYNSLAGASNRFLTRPVLCGSTCLLLTGTRDRVLSDWGLGSDLVGLVPNLGDTLEVVGISKK